MLSVLMLSGFTRPLQLADVEATVAERDNRLKAANANEARRNLEMQALEHDMKDTAAKLEAASAEQ